MRFKLDENFGTRTQELIRQHGHDVQSVRDQRLQGASDRDLFQSCRSHRRRLLTLDLGFADVTSFPPAESSGIVVIRVPQSLTLDLLEQLVTQFLRTVATESIDKKLFVAEVGRVRVHQSGADA